MREIMECKKNILGGGRQIDYVVVVIYFSYQAPIGFRMNKVLLKFQGKK